MFINYAHRGASAYAPENTMLSFYLGVHMQANGIETDVQMTKDGVLVLFHDDSLLRVTGQPGSVSDYTFAQLQNFWVKTNGSEDKIVSLADFLEHFSYRPLQFAIELKQPHIEKSVIDLLNQYEMREKTVITSFDFENLVRARDYDRSYEIGYLTRDTSEEAVSKLQSLGAEEICPEAKLLTPELVQALHAQGLRVRAWGVKDEELMIRAHRCGCDGMTVNFPDKLQQYLGAMEK